MGLGGVLGAVNILFLSFPVNAHGLRHVTGKAASFVYLLLPAGKTSK